MSKLSMSRWARLGIGLGFGLLAASGSAWAANTAKTPPAAKAKAAPVAKDAKAAPAAKAAETKPDAKAEAKPDAKADAKADAKDAKADAKGDAKADEKGDEKGDDKEGKAEEPPNHVKVGVYVLNIGKFEVATGTYTVDFYLDLTSERPMGDMKVEFMNGRAAGPADKLIDKPTEKFYRYQANLMTNVDMRRYPWDTHELPIILESTTDSKEKVVFEVDEKQQGIDPAVNFVGWDLRGFSTEIRDHEYKVYGETYSQYIYKIEIARLFFISSLKTFLPVMCFLLISFVSLLVTLEKLDSRVGMNTAMLIASVMFHLSIGSQLPPAGYLTIADKVMIATYATIGINLLLSVMMMRFIQLKREDTAKAMRAQSFKLVPALAALAYFVVVVT